MSVWLVGAALACLTAMGAVAGYALWRERGRPHVDEPPHTRFRMGDGIAFIAFIPLAAFCKTWRGAMREGAWIEVLNDGRPVVVNPHQIIYAEQWDHDSLDRNIL